MENVILKNLKRRAQKQRRNSQILKIQCCTGSPCCTGLKCCTGLPTKNEALKKT